MNILTLTILLICIKLCWTQNIISLMAGDTSISKFYNILKNNQDFLTKLDRSFLCVLAPSDVAINAITSFSPTPDFLNRHIFDSKANFVEQIGSIATLSQYSRMTTRTGPVYYIINNYLPPSSYFYFTNTTTPPPMVNGAQIVAPDKTSGNQVYHVIDRVLLNSYPSDFSTLISQNPAFSQTNIMWQRLRDAYINHKFTTNTTFFGTPLQLSNDNPGTMLVPTNDAWTSLSPADQNRLNNPDELAKVMARLYIPNRIMFLHNQPLYFRAGFSVNPGVEDSNNLDGKYFRIAQTDMVQVQGFVATVITPNVVFQGGVLHVIGATLAVSETRQAYLKRRAPAFYAAVSADSDLASAMNSSNITVLAPDDQTMATVALMDPVTRKQVLMNCIIPGVLTMANSDGVYVQTAGNGTLVRIRVSSNNRITIDTVASQAEKTFVNRARVVSSDDTVDSVNINIIRGTIGNISFNCSSMLTVLNRRVYNSLINSLGVPLSLGSPYTLFAPSDVALSSLTGVSMGNRSTVGTSSITHSPAASPSVATTTLSTVSSSTTTSTSTTGSTKGSSTSATTLNNTSTGNNNYQRYLLQRMIVANRLVLGLRSTGSFKAATMNYAAMQEMIDISIASNNQVTIGINGVMVPGPAIDDGFYCSSNDQSQGDRRNLVYPTASVLTTGQDASMRVCVVAPCAGCVVRSVWCLVVALVTVVGAYVARE